MELAVKQLLYNAARNDDREVLSAQTEEISLLAETDQYPLLPHIVICCNDCIFNQICQHCRKIISAERAGIVRTYEQSGKRYSPIGIPVLDALFTYMVQKADSAGIELNGTSATDIKLESCCMPKNEKIISREILIKMPMAS